MMQSTAKTMEALELEPALPENGNHTEQQQQQRARSPMEFCRSLWALLVAYTLYYRAVSATLLVIFFMLLMIFLLESIAYHATSKTRVPHITHDYNELSSVYDLKMAKIDHWCLGGDDDSCRCADPNQPSARGEIKGWARAHRLNKESSSSMAMTATSGDWLDVVFVGDETIEAMNGRILSRPTAPSASGQKLFNGTFTKEGGGDLDALALGIDGDYISTVLWRLDHDELPPELDAKVYWIVVGGNDLSRGQCSEEVVVLGLLRLAEELKQRRPDSIVVINSILPRLPPPSKNKHKWKHAKQAPLLDVWPSIQIVNHVLDKYCRNHPEIQFFDSTALFFGGDNKRKVDDSLFQSTLMLEDRVHLSRKGYKVWGQAVADKVKEIVHEEDTS